MIVRIAALIAAGLLLSAATARPALKPEAVTAIGQVALSNETYNGRPALRVAAAAPAGSQADSLVMLPVADFHDGTIELMVSGEPGPGANAGARGFVGVAFRATPDGKTTEAFYLRPSNGRAEDQERRNHAVQYVSHPDWTWDRLRKETPSRYESYVDLVPGRWTRMRVEVAGAKARLFVDGAEQPVLIVNDLKRGADATGGVGLWIGPGTIARFAEVSVTPK
jgi:hypothetical protein